MKNFPFLMLFSAFAIVSCSNDDSFTDLGTNEKMETTTNALKRTVSFDAENKSNPFDNAGKAYNAILDAYSNENSLSNNPEKIAETVESIANSLPEFMALKTSNDLTVVDYETLRGIMDGEYAFENAMSDSSLSSNAKTVLNNFITDLESQVENQSMATVHAFIMEFENNLPQQTNLSSNDRKIILTTTSIARYVNAEKSDSDPDKIWIHVKNGITATLNGMFQNTAKGVLNATVVTILQKRKN